MKYCCCFVSTFKKAEAKRIDCADITEVISFGHSVNIDKSFVYQLRVPTQIA